MTSKKDIILIYFLLTIEVLILLNSKTVMQSVIKSCNMFVLKILSGILPSMIVGTLLVKLGVHKIIPRFIKKIFNKLFNFNDAMTSIFITSLICGSPSSAAFINEYLNNNKISEKNALNLLCCTHFINPLFVIGTVGIGIFNSARIGISLFILLTLSNLIKAFILRKNFIGKKNIYNINDHYNFINEFKKTLSTCSLQLLVIFAIVVLFNVLVSLIGNIFDLSIMFETIINMFLEMTGGITKLSTIDINLKMKFILSYYTLSFGGLCIWMQTISMITNKKIKYLKYFIFRLF